MEPCVFVQSLLTQRHPQYKSSCADLCRLGQAVIIFPSIFWRRGGSSCLSKERILNRNINPSVSQNLIWSLTAHFYHDKISDFHQLDVVLNFFSLKSALKQPTGFIKNIWSFLAPTFGSHFLWDSVTAIVDCRVRYNVLFHCGFASNLCGYCAWDHCSTAWPSLGQAVEKTVSHLTLEKSGWLNDCNVALCIIAKHLHFGLICPCSCSRSLVLCPHGSLQI